MGDGTLSGGQVSLPVRPDTTGFGNRLRSGIETESSGLGALGSHLGAKLVAGFAVLEIGRKIGQFISDGFKEYDAADKINAQFTAGLASTGNVANLTLKSMDKLAESISGYSGQSYASIGATEQVLQTFTNLRNVGPDKIFDQATTAAANMAAKLGGDATGSAIQLGKALQDPIKGMASLRRVGVMFTQSQSDQVKALVKSGDMIGAQKIILAELNTEFGGAAKAAGQTLPGAYARLQVASGELSKKFVTVLAPSLVVGANQLIKLLDKLQSNKEFQKFLSDIGVQFGKMAPSIEKILPSLGEAVIKLLPSLLKIVVALVPLLPSITSAFVALAPALTVVVQGLVYMLTNLSVLPIITFFGKLLDNLSKGKDSLADFQGLLQALPGPLKEVTSGFITFVGGALNAFLGGINGTVSAVEGVLNPIASFLHLPTLHITPIALTNWGLLANEEFAKPQQVSKPNAPGSTANGMRSMASGGTVMPTPGGTIVRMAEAGVPETVVDTRTLQAAMASRSGPAVQFGDIYQQPGTTIYETMQAAGFVAGQFA